jgi:endonuclease III
MADPGKRALSLYGKMLSEYGPQGWWPAKSRYEVVVGALLTQNTNWTNVEKAIANLREKRVLSPEKILLIKTEKLERLIRPSGFYRQKAERLKLLTGRYAEIIGPGGGGVPTPFHQGSRQRDRGFHPPLCLRPPEFRHRRLYEKVLRSAWPLPFR